MLGLEDHIKELHSEKEKLENNINIYTEILDKFPDAEVYRWSSDIKVYSKSVKNLVDSLEIEASLASHYLPSALCFNNIPIITHVDISVYYNYKGIPVLSEPYNIHIGEYKFELDYTTLRQEIYRKLKDLGYNKTIIDKLLINCEAFKRGE